MSVSPLPIRSFSSQIRVLSARRSRRQIRAATAGNSMSSASERSKLPSSHSPSLTPATKIDSALELGWQIPPLAPQPHPRRSPSGLPKLLPRLIRSVHLIPPPVHNIEHIADRYASPRARSIYIEQGERLVRLATFSEADAGGRSGGRGGKPVACSSGISYILVLVSAGEEVEVVEDGVDGERRGAGRRRLGGGRLEELRRSTKEAGI